MTWTNWSQGVQRRRTGDFNNECEILAFACRSETRAKPRRLATACSSSWTVFILERTFFDFEPGPQFDQAYLVETKEQALFFYTDNYHENMMERSNAGDWKMIFGTNVSTPNVGLMMYGSARRQDAETTIKDFNSGHEIRYLRFLHSRRNLIHPTLQDNMLIPNNFWEYICILGGCVVNLHYITNSGLIAGGQN